MQRARMKLCEHGQGGVGERQLGGGDELGGADELGGGDEVGGADERQPRALSAKSSAARAEQRYPRGASG
jgi:hypothetical protein